MIYQLFIYMKFMNGKNKNNIMKNPEKLIGKKVLGFKFEGRKGCTFNANMIDVVGLKGEIDIYERELNSFKVRFSDIMYWHYPADQIEAHLVNDETPTLSDGVMMLVSDDEINWEPRKVVLKSKEGFYVKGLVTSSLVFYSYAKSIEPTKEEQLTAILGSSDKVSEIMELFKN